METIIDYGMNGEGVAKQDGKVILINNAIIDEQVEFEITKDYKNYSVAKVKTITLQSPMRQEPPCPYFYECGGCNIQHMKYAEQLKFKQQLVKKTLKKIANIDVNVNKTVPSSSIFNYRNKISFNQANNCFGFFKENSKNIVELNNCMLAHQNLNHVFNAIKQYLKTNNLVQYIKNIVIREIDNQMLVAIVAVKHVDISNLYQLLHQQHGQIGLYLVINTRKDSVVLSGKIQHIAGLKEINISNFNINYNVDILGFHQTNIDIQNKIYEKVLSFIDENSNVLNGFSGQGLLTAILSTKANHVYGIEINKSSHLSAENLKKQNKISNMTNILGDFNKEIKSLISKVDTIILDPSKKGCGKQVMQEIVGVKNIIYISCNPIALAKDLCVLKEHYSIKEVTPFDMFPQTKNVETVVKLALK